MKPRRVIVKIELNSSRPIEQIERRYRRLVGIGDEVLQVQANVKRPERKIRLRMRGRNYSARGFAAAIRSEKQKGK